VLVSADTAFTEKEENDPTGCTTWGVWTDAKDGFPKVMLLAAWRKHLPIHGLEQDPEDRGESEEDYLRRCLPHWGIVEHVNCGANRFGGADDVVIEGRRLSAVSPYKVNMLGRTIFMLSMASLRFLRSHDSRHLSSISLRVCSSSSSLRNR
jgi:hypothetical protein